MCISNNDNRIFDASGQVRPDARPIHTKLVNVEVNTYFDIKENIEAIDYSWTQPCRVCGKIVLLVQRIYVDPAYGRCDDVAKNWPDYTPVDCSPACTNMREINPLPYEEK